MRVLASCFDVMMIGQGALRLPHQHKQAQYVLQLLAHEVVERHSGDPDGLAEASGTEEGHNNLVEEEEEDELDEQADGRVPARGEREQGDGDDTTFAALSGLCADPRCSPSSCTS